MSLVIPSFARRVHFQEKMDDPSVGPEEFSRALRELRAVNVFLGGHRALRHHFVPYLKSCRGNKVSVLDLGTGIADYPERMVRWGAEFGVDVRVRAIDANPTVVACARSFLDESLPPHLRSRVEVRQADVRSLDLADNSFDVVTASLFLHHFDDEDCRSVLREMDRLASDGLIVNDLHRHILAYAGIRIVAAVLSVSEMFAHDGPLSVRRAFRPAEMHRIASEAGLKGARVNWHWAFRLTLSSL